MTHGFTKLLHKFVEPRETIGQRLQKPIG